MDTLTKLLPALGRILIALIFVLAGFDKLGRLDATIAHMTDAGMPYSNILVWGAVAVELGCGLLLVAGLWTRFAALVLFLYTLALALIFHAYWTFPAAAAREQHAVFFGHMAMMGGMLYVVAFGAGGWSLDGLLARRK